MATFGQHLCAAMERQDVTVRELGKQMDVHEKTIYRWRDHPRGPNISDCARIAQALGVPITDLVPTPRAAESIDRSDL
jgi:transcriptional regulator with XRE-family HTH domain